MFHIFNGSEHKVNPADNKNEPPPVAAMSPLFGRRSIIGLAIGLIVGAVLGIGYWIVSPSFLSSDQTTPAPSSGGFADFLGAANTGLYESRVNVQVVSPGSSYMSLKDLQRMGEYYGAKAISRPFFLFLSQELAEQSPEYAYTADELYEIILVRYDWKSEFPAMEVKVTGSSEEEALFLAGFLPDAFQRYLIAEENEKRQDEYQYTLKKIESVKASIVETEEEISALISQGGASNIYTNPTYIALSTKIESLELQLNIQAAELAALIAAGNIGEEGTSQKRYQDTLKEMGAVQKSILDAEQELSTLALQRAAGDINNNPDYVILYAKVTALELELDMLMAELTNMIARGATSSQLYEDTQEDVERASTALVEARMALIILENQVTFAHLEVAQDYRFAQAKVETLNKTLNALSERLILLSPTGVGGDNPLDAQLAFTRTSTALAEARRELIILESQENTKNSGKGLDYQVARATLATLKNEMGILTEKLSLLLGNNFEPEEITGYLVAGNPSIPIPVLPERVRARNALMWGVIIGLGGAFVLLNYRWIAKGMPASSPDLHGEDDEEDA